MSSMIKMIQPIDAAFGPSPSPSASKIVVPAPVSVLGELSTSNEVQHSYTDVLIIGAGPAGLFAAQALARLGINIKTIDRRAPNSLYGNADGLAPRSLEIWDSYGLTDRVKPKGAYLYGLVTYQKSSDGSLTRSGPIKNIDIPTKFPYELTMSIKIIEGTLRESLEGAGGTILQPVWPESIFVAEDPNGSEYPVQVLIHHGREGTESPFNYSADHIARSEVVHAKYVLGADGAHSWVRQALNIELKGDQTEHIWGVVDAIVDTDFPDYRFKTFVQTPEGALILIPRENNMLRVYTQMCSDDGLPRRSDGRLDKAAVDQEHLRQRVEIRTKGGLAPYRFEFKHVFWSTLFSVSQGVATSFSHKNRVFIVGDASHTHSPKAGQGANASMSDSHNLAWKLAYVLRGWASPSLLKTYGQEREQYARDLIAFDKQLSKLVDGGSSAEEYVRLTHEFKKFTSGVGISYRKSDLTQISNIPPAISVQPGDRIPPAAVLRLADWSPMNLQDLAPSDGLFKLFIFPGNLLIPAVKERLQSFADALSKESSTIRARFLITYTILWNSKMQVLWNEIPSALIDSWKNSFVPDDSPNSLDIYESFGIESDLSGLIFLVRPDGYISFIQTLDDPSETVHQLFGFLRNL